MASLVRLGWKWLVLTHFAFLIEIVRRENSTGRRDEQWSSPRAGTEVQRALKCKTVNLNRRQESLAMVTAAHHDSPFVKPIHIPCQSLVTQMPKINKSGLCWKEGGRYRNAKQAFCMTRGHLARWHFLPTNVFLWGEDGLLLGVVCYEQECHLGKHIKTYQPNSKLWARSPNPARTGKPCYLGFHFLPAGASKAKSLEPGKAPSFPCNTWWSFWPFVIFTYDDADDANVGN